MTVSTTGKFSKGVEGSVSVNFSESGGDNCSNRCKMKGAGCYSEVMEAMRPNVKQAGIKRRKLGPVQLANKAAMALKFVRSPWIRFSVSGSLPMIATANKAKGFKAAFQNLVLECLKTGAKLHIPCETKEKTEFYQKWVSEVAPKVIVRESCQSENRLFKSELPNSFVVGKTGDKKPAKMAVANRIITRLRNKGKKAILCPAIVSNSKCGQCTACSNPNVNTVVYLKH